MTITTTPIDLNELDRATGLFMRRALSKKHDPSAAIAILAVLHSRPEWGSAEHDLLDRVAGQLTRNVLAVPGMVNGVSS